MRRWNKVRKVWAGVTFVSFLLAILGFICAYAIFPAVIDSRIFDHLNLWDDNSFGRRSFVILFSDQGLLIRTIKTCHFFRIRHHTPLPGGITFLP